MACAFLLVTPQNYNDVCRSGKLRVGSVEIEFEHALGMKTSRISRLVRCLVCKYSLYVILFVYVTVTEDWFGPVWD